MGNDTIWVKFAAELVSPSTTAYVEDEEGGKGDTSNTSDDGTYDCASVW